MSWKLSLKCCLSIWLILFLSGCAQSHFTALDVHQALQEQDLEVTKIEVASAEENRESGSLLLNGIYPKAFNLKLPTGDMSHNEFVFVYEFTSKEERESSSISDKVSSLQIANLYPSIREENNLIVIYWYKDKENPLMIMQFTKALDNL